MTCVKHNKNSASSEELLTHFSLQMNIRKSVKNALMMKRETNGQSLLSFWKEKKFNFQNSGSKQQVWLSKKKRIEIWFLMMQMMSIHMMSTMLMEWASKVLGIEFSQEEWEKLLTQMSSRFLQSLENLKIDNLSQHMKSKRAKKMNFLENHKAIIISSNTER